MARVGVNVTLGRLPGSTTLNGFNLGSVTKLCIRWLMPTPVRPAIHAGIHPPLGTTETTQPSLSVASMEVVPAHTRLRYSSSSVPDDFSSDAPFHCFKYSP